MQIHDKETASDASDLELVNSIKLNNCKLGLAELSSRHGGLYCSLITKMSHRYTNWYITADLLMDKEFVIYNSALKFDPGKKTKFSTFLGNETKWHYLNRCNQQKRTQNQISVTDEILALTAMEPSHEAHICEKDTINYIFKALNSHPDKRISKIFKLRYKIGKLNKVMPWHLIGKELNLSAQGCINIHKVGIRYLQDKLKKEGLLNA